MQREEKTEIITLRVTPQVKERIRAKAREVNLTVTDYLCLCGLGKKIVQVDGLDQVLSELKAQGRNLNQLTTLANMGKITVVYGDRLAEGYAQVSEQLYQLLREVSNGAPARAQQSGSCGERTSSGVNEACRKRQAERYAACEDDAAVGFKQPPYLKAVACRFGCLASLLLCPSSVTRPDLKVSAIQQLFSMPHTVFAPCFRFCSHQRTVMDAQHLSALQMLQLFVLTAGDEHLSALDAVEHEALPPLVQLREHIIQQQHGPSSSDGYDNPAAVSVATSSVL